jgi:hypothetical protein
VLSSAPALVNVRSVFAPAFFALALLALLVASPATSAAQEPTEASAVPKDGLERRQALPPSPAQVSINGALRGGVQWILNPPRARDDTYAFGALDAVLSLRPTPNITAIADVEALAGPGPDQALSTLSRVNAESERLEDHDKRLWLREAWLRFQFLDGHVRFNIGKLDVTHYFDRNFFAEDETRQFLDSALLEDPMLRPPPNGPGASLRISQGDWRYALGVHEPVDFNADLSGLPYFIFELGRRDILALSGHYRWWTRVGSVPERRKDVTWGTGVSFDQLITADTGVFMRAGLSRSEGASLTSHAWSAGVQHSPSWLDRTKDLTGVGFSVQREVGGYEYTSEIYYNLSLAGCCSVIANIEWILSGPNQVTGRRNRDVIVPGLRAVTVF